MYSSMLVGFNFETIRVLLTLRPKNKDDYRKITPCKNASQP